MITRRLLAASIGCLALFAANAAHAAAINYGSFGPVPPGVTFVSVTESSGTDPVPLFGPPSVFPVGLDFNPSNSFSASSTGTGADITDGQLNFTITAPTISTISIFEAGDYTLQGPGTASTTASAGAILRATVTAIDGVNVAPITLIPVNASVSFNLVANPAIVQPWSLGLSLNVESQLMALNVPFTSGATRVDVVIDDSLVAVSEVGSASLIAKKDFRVDVPVIPEPAMASFLGLGLSILVLRRRR